MKSINHVFERTLLIFLFGGLSLQSSFAQGLVIKDQLKQRLNDGSAFHAPLDGQGKPSGLIRVRCDVPNLSFKGDVIGEVEYQMNEYWVYLASGSKSIKIVHPNYLPLLIDFNEIEIGEIQSKATYSMTLGEQKFKKEKCGLQITTTPIQAKVYINDLLIENSDNNGYYQLYLPKGTYICRIEQEGYRPFVNTFSMRKESQALQATLESVMAELNVKCKDNYAEIYVDDELRGTGSWNGLLLPGSHSVEARLKNYDSQSQNIVLEERDNRTIVIQQLKRSSGTLRIETNPQHIPIIIDGKSVGKSPYTITLESGAHNIICNPKEQYDCKKIRAEVDVQGGDTTKVLLKIGRKENRGYQSETYDKAYAGDIDAVVELACEKSWDEDSYDEALFWAERIPNVERMFSVIKFDGSDNSHSLALLCNPDKFAERLKQEEQKEPNDMWKKDYGFGTRLSQGYGYLGNSYKMRGEYDKAIACYLKADRYGVEGLGDCYAAKGDKAKAISCYRQLLNGNSYGDERIQSKIDNLTK